MDDGNILGYDPSERLTVGKVYPNHGSRHAVVIGTKPDGLPKAIVVQDVVSFASAGPPTYNPIPVKDQADGSDACFGYTYHDDYREGMPANQGGRKYVFHVGKGWEDVGPAPVAAPEAVLSKADYETKQFHDLLAGELRPGSPGWTVGQAEPDTYVQYLARFAIGGQKPLSLTEKIDRVVAAALALLQ